MIKNQYVFCNKNMKNDINDWFSLYYLILMDLEKIENIKKMVDLMKKQHHIEILKIIKKNPAIKINENKSGVYINISFLPIQTIEEIQAYIDYVQDQEKLLMPFETQKEDFKNTFFVEKEDKEEVPSIYSYQVA